MPLILFFEGLRSERHLLRLVTDRLRLRRYSGYDLGERLPGHSSLTRIRDHFGLDRFRSLTEAVVEQCVTAGAVWGEGLDVDATDGEANASLDSLRPRFAVEAHLARLFAADGRGDEQGGGEGRGKDRGEDEPTRVPIAFADEALPDPADGVATGHDRVGEAGRPGRQRAVPTGGRRTPAPAPPTRTPPRCGRPGAALASATATIASSTAARPGSS